MYSVLYQKYPLLIIILNVLGFASCLHYCSHITQIFVQVNEVRIGSDCRYLLISTLNEMFWSDIKKKQLKNDVTLCSSRYSEKTVTIVISEDLT